MEPKASSQKRSAGIIVVRKDPAGDYQPLVLRAYKNWDFPKGVVEAGEDPLSAAKRETKEETTLSDLEFNWGYEFRETEPYAQGKIARYYIAESGSNSVALPTNPLLGRPEHDEYRWVTFGEARSLLPARLHLILEWARSVVEPW